MVLKLCSNVHLHRKPGVVKKDLFAAMVECGETAPLPLEELAAMVDNVRMLSLLCTYMHAHMQICSDSNFLLSDIFRCMCICFSR